MRPKRGHSSASLKPKNEFGNDVAEAKLRMRLTKPTLTNMVHDFRQWRGARRKPEGMCVVRARSNL
jgi:hypothetical protein